MTTTIETDPLKFYLARFSFLAFALVLWTIALTVWFLPEFQNHRVLVSIIFLSTGVLLFYLFLKVSEKVKRVAISNNKIVVSEREFNWRFGWPEVKSVKTVPLINLYRLKLRGREAIYFFPERKIEPALEQSATFKSRWNRSKDRKKSKS